MTQPIHVLNGPNLDRLGTRETALYGTATLAEIEAICRRAAGRRPLVFRQSNAEHEMIGWVHEAIDGAGALVINPAGLSFRSVPLLDALRMFPGPVIEVHLTNIHRRAPPHQVSLISPAATAVICGLGTEGYRAAIAAALALAPAR